MQEEKDKGDVAGFEIWKFKVLLLCKMQCNMKTNAQEKYQEM